MAKKSPFTKGRRSIPAGDSDGAGFISLKDGDKIQLAPLQGLDGMISADMHEYWDIRPAIYHPCVGKDCPGCAVGNEPRFKGYMPVVVKGEDGVSIWPFTISVYRQLETLEEALYEDGKDLGGNVLAVSRQGSSLKTRYSIMGTGRTVDMTDIEEPDFISRLGPQTIPEIWDLLEENGFERPDAAPKTVVEDDPDEAGEDDDDDDWGEV